MENKQQEQSKNDALVRGEAFYRLTKERGWEFIKKYFELRLQSFATTLLTSEKPIVEFERERMELVGLRKLLGYVDESIKFFQKDTESTKE